MDNRKTCKVGQVCDSVKFSYTTAQYDISEWKNASQLLIVLQDAEVQHHISYINYDLQSLISEIGGILGLTLGASVLSMAESTWICLKRNKIFKTFA